jgi:hypothetical protein
MANRLSMLKSQGIQSLAAAGHSERAIAKALRVSRGAVRRHLWRPCQPSNLRKVLCQSPHSSQSTTHSSILSIVVSVP